MGTIWSAEKTFHTLRETREKTLVTWTDDELIHPHISNLPREDFKHRNPKLSFSFHGRNGKSAALKQKSQSLNAIVEELCSSGSKQSLQDFEIKKPLIPRIKLTRSLSSLKEERRHKAQSKMSGKPESHNFAAESENSQQCLYLPNEDKGGDLNADEPGIFPKIELPKKPDENYFANNFDECMKRLQLIEKEHEMMEKDGDDNIHLYFLSGEEPPSEEVEEKDRGKMSSGNESEERRDGNKSENFESVAALETAEKGDATPEDTQEAKPEWYTSLKQQFEGSEEENQDQKAKEMSCRIMGATLKNSNDPQKPENKEKDTRHYFSRLVKSNKSLIDEELPDPDKVKNIRAMFQENLNSTLKRKLNKKLGGSLQNINVRASEQQMARPLSAQCYRDEIVGEIRDHDSEKPNKTSEISETKDSDKEFQIENTKKKLFEKYDKELKIGRDLKGRKLLQQKWTDTGSMSSGVSSDLSSYDTDVESFSKEGMEHEPDEVTISDDDLLDEGKDKHYVQNEILEKIRSFGTSVTYYGGEMITCSVGPLLSPTTQAIMEEIGVKYGDEVGGTRSFDEFYRKYVETNEPNRKKKLGRARSFGQNDVFQKPNVLSNREIEIYKNDLEIEIGIKKPSGIPLNGLKPKLAKSNSVGNSSEKPLETFSQPPVIKIDAATEDIPLENEINSESKNVEPETENRIVEEALEEENSKPVEKDSRVTINSEESEKSETVQIIANIETPGEISEEKEFPAEAAPVKEIKFESAPKEILFGYEKSYLNGKPTQDMEFEEFQVCETVEEKLEKLQELNSARLLEKSETPADTDGVSESGPEETSKANSSRRKWNINLNEETDGTKPVASVEQEQGGAEFPVSEAFNNEKNRNDDIFYLEHQSPVTENNQSNKKYPEHSHSRWPIETSVMVDMQKTDEQTPKLLSNGKTVAKTKIRLF